MRRTPRHVSLLTLLVAALLFAGCDESSLPTQSTSNADGPALPQSTSEHESKNVYQPANPSEDVIPGQYIVVLEDRVAAPGTPVAQSAVRNAAARFGQMGGVAVTHTYQNALSGFAAELSDAALAQVKADPQVAFVEPDRRVHAIATQNNATWGLDRVDQRSGLDGSYEYTATGSGVTAYIIDTGVRTSHSDFGGRASPGYDAFGGNAQDQNGHGTHVAGTVGGSTYGVAKGVNLVAVKVLDADGSGSNSGVIAGVDWVAANANGPSVANMSLGGGASGALDNAVQNAIGSGVTFVVAAGNDDTDACSKSPARVDGALTTGSTTSSDARSSFSNYGSCVDIFAPGSSITSAWFTSNNAINTISGTSMAAPHVAGAAALYLQGTPGASPAQVFSGVTSTATQGAVSDVNGSPNLLLYSPLVENDNGGGGGNGGGGSDAPCSSCASYSGSLSATGEQAFQPNGDYYQSDGGTQQGYLRGPGNADFDLYLWKWNGSRWVTVASSTSPSSSEDIAYDGSAGSYAWRVYSYNGSGSYDFYANQ